MHLQQDYFNSKKRVAMVDKFDSWVFKIVIIIITLLTVQRNSMVSNCEAIFYILESKNSDYSLVRPLLKKNPHHDFVDDPCADRRRRVENLKSFSPYQSAHEFTYSTCELCGKYYRYFY